MTSAFREFFYGFGGVTLGPISYSFVADSFESMTIKAKIMQLRVMSSPPLLNIWLSSLVSLILALIEFVFELQFSVNGRITTPLDASFFLLNHATAPSRFSQAMLELLYTIVVLDFHF